MKPRIEGLIAAAAARSDVPMPCYVDGRTIAPLCEVCDKRPSTVELSALGYADADSARVKYNARPKEVWFPDCGWALCDACARRVWRKQEDYYKGLSLDDQGRSRYQLMTTPIEVAREMHNRFRYIRWVSGPAEPKYSARGSLRAVLR